MRKTISTVLLLLFFAGLFSASACTEKPDNPADSNVLVQFKIDKNTQDILLPVKFQGREYLFDLDTGASYTLFDISLKDKLGKPKRTVKVETVTGRFDAQLYDAPQAFLGPLNLKVCRTVAVVDFTEMSAAFGKKRHGTIGMNFLKKYVLQIDSDKGIVSFIKPRSSGGIFSFLWPKNNDHPHWGEQVSMKYELVSGIPHIKANVGGSKVDFMIDTGYCAFVDLPDFPASDTFGELERKIFKKVSSVLQSENKQSSQITPKGKAPSDFTKSTVIGRFSVGPLEYKDVTLDEGSESKLGMSFFSRHLVTFDFPNRKMYLKKGSYFDRVSDDYISMKDFGFVLRRKRDDIFVSSVDPNGPAYKKGMKQNDSILKVNEHNVASASLTEILTVFISVPPETRTLAVTIKRDDDIKQFYFTIEKKQNNKGDPNAVD